VQTPTVPRLAVRRDDETIVQWLILESIWANDVASHSELGVERQGICLADNVAQAYK
jgi:hypothetical protein